MWCTETPFAHHNQVVRIVKPGGVIIVSFSRHCFREKATAAWLERDAQGRVALVERILLAAGASDVQSLCRNVYENKWEEDGMWVC